MLTPLPVPLQSHQGLNNDFVAYRKTEKERQGLERRNKDENLLPLLQWEWVEIVSGL